FARPQEHRRAEESPPQAHPPAPGDEREHENPEPDHDAKGEERISDGRPLIARPILQAAHEPVRIVREDETAEIGNRELIVIGRVRVVGYRKEYERDA